jgi:hypothetical protein
VARIDASRWPITRKFLLRYTWSMKIFFGQIPEGWNISADAVIQTSRRKFNSPCYYINISHKSQFVNTGLYLPLKYVNPTWLFMGQSIFPCFFASRRVFYQIHAHLKITGLHMTTKCLSIPSLLLTTLLILIQPHLTLSQWPASLIAERTALEHALLHHATSATICVQQHAERIEFAHANLALSADRKSASWNALWAGTPAVAILGAFFSVEIDGQLLILTDAESTIKPFIDPVGHGQELQQTWQINRVRVVRELRVYDSLNVITVGGRIINNSGKDITLGNVHNVEVDSTGRWQLGDATEKPAAIYTQNHFLLRSMPFMPKEANASSEQNYSSQGVLALAGRNPSVALALGFVRADEASPFIQATFKIAADGTRLVASSRFPGRRLGADKVVELNRLYISSDHNVFQMMEHFGQAMADFSEQPVHTGPTGLWCSWYAHRMGMTEDLVLANAKVAARYFKPLGLEIMQLDHGWQRGDITGDWVTNTRFPHGLSWLAEQLRKQYGLRLGLWIAPTDVAETSELYQKHSEWMLKDESGKPKVNWKWYWKPNPDCFELDATNPAAAEYIAKTFRYLSQQGVSYYKIDFIAAAGGEHFIQHDSHATAGWSNLRLAMQAIRAGAGPQAWIRYCQTPPVLSAGLANSVIGGDDTLDAGVPGYFGLLTVNAGHLAAGWWLNDHPYHREVCDMSVRMQAGIEEARVRAAIMTLANCSISWSDELSYLPPSRIRLMQQCMPPGNPAMRPLDIFERDIPSIWHIKMTNAVETWDVVGFFNFTAKPELRKIRFEQLGLDTQAEYFAFEFWEEKYLGCFKNGLELMLPPESSRIVSIRRQVGHPQLIGTDMHLLQGWHEIRDLQWSAGKNMLSGIYHRAPGMVGKAFFYLPEGWNPKFDFPLSPASAQLTHVEGPIWMQEINFSDADFKWAIPFEPLKPPPAKESIGPGTNQ